MDLMQSLDAILFPADGRPPHVVSLIDEPGFFLNSAHTGAACPRSTHGIHCGGLQHEGLALPDHRGAGHDEQEVRKPIPSIYYPAISRDGIPLPVNRTMRDIQEELNKGHCCCNNQLWCGNLVTAKFEDNHSEEMMDASMADFPILKNFLATHPSPIRITSVPGAPIPPTPTHPLLQPHPSNISSTRISNINSSSISRKSITRQAFPPAHAKCNYAEPAGRHPLGYEREPAASAHVVPVTVPSLCRDSRPPGTEQHVHPMELQTRTLNSPSLSPLLPVKQRKIQFYRRSSPRLDTPPARIWSSRC
ncbi:hypothetical protein V8E53_000017 [Lactarius tabidus]